MSKFTADWIGSRPVFYNEKNSRVSKNINDVIDFRDFEFHPEGLNNYLDFGFSVFEQTPVKFVKFSQHSSTLSIDGQGRLTVENHDDPLDNLLGKRSHEDDVLHGLQTKINEWERREQGKIVIPTSSGYDSRMLNAMVEDKKRIQSFTYGVSADQSRSKEVVYAQKLSELLGSEWRQIVLGEYHRYIPDWIDLYGISTHAHGMYHIEFYTKILPYVPGGNPLLSGLGGDWWSGHVTEVKVDSPKDLRRMAYLHGLHACSRYARLQSEGELIGAFFEANRYKLRSWEWQVILMARMKMILLSYLTTVPDHFGFRVYSPFTDIEIAAAMLNLPEEKRRKRVWMQRYFKMNNLDLESMKLRARHSNTLYISAMEREPLRALRPDLLREIIDPRYVVWINRNIAGNRAVRRIRSLPFSVRYIKGVVSLSGLQNPVYNAYNAYITLRPLEDLIEKRNRA